MRCDLIEQSGLTFSAGRDVPASLAALLIGAFVLAGGTGGGDAGGAGTNAGDLLGENPTESDKQFEVAEQLPKGLSRREIAQEMGVGTETVKTHIRSIYAKLGVNDRVGAVRVIQTLFPR